MLQVTTRPTGSISVIIPVHTLPARLPQLLANARPLLGTLLEEIIIVDNSREGLAELHDLVPQDPRVHILHEPKLGPGPARNLGLNKARGDWVLFADSDDTVHFEILEAAIQQFESAEETTVLSFGCCVISPDGSETFAPATSSREMILHRPTAFVRNLYRRSTLMEQKVNFPDGLVAEDLVFLCRLYPYISSIAAIRSVLCTIHDDASSTSRTRDARWLVLPLQLARARQPLSEVGATDIWLTLLEQNAVSGLLSCPSGSRGTYLRQLIMVIGGNTTVAGALHATAAVGKSIVDFIRYKTPL